jgi:hypothetical protein
MRKVLFCIVICFFVISLSTIIRAETLLYDDFSGNSVSSSKWHIPTWVSPTDGTVVGLTNPTAFSFYGTDLRSNQSFALGTGIHITVRAKMNTTTPGIVGGIFLYALKPGSTTYHDEIDFELLTNLPNGVQTNIYSNEKLGTGNVQFVPYTSGSITDYHTYEIKWQPNHVSWFIDGNLVRTDTRYVPTGPMTFHLNIWVPDPGWPAAYDPNLKPATSASSNQIFSMSVDSVNIQSITPPIEASGLAPIPPLQLLDKAP